MFGLALSRRLIQGPAVRSWNNITHFASLLWCKFNHNRNSVMPRSRKHYHSRSRSRSRSHSYDRDRDLKRRRIDSGDTSPYRRSVSPEDHVENILNEEGNSGISTSMNYDIESNRECKVSLVDCANLVEQYTTVGETNSLEQNCMDQNALDNSELHTSIDEKTKIATKTVKKSLTPAQKRKSIERQKQREAKRAELELKRKQSLEEKLRIKNDKEKEREEKRKAKQEKEDQKLKEKQKEKEVREEKKKKELEEREQKRKEKEEKDELKRKEKEEKDELKRKEKEEKEEHKRKELEEKQKEEEKKQKVSARFVNFFTKKSDVVTEEKKSDESAANISFMPFKIKADMRLAPVCRRTLTDIEKSNITDLKTAITKLYLDELKRDKIVRTSEKTWPFDGFDDDDVIIVEDSAVGESIEDIPKTQKFRAKFFKFEENRRPPYFGTWRKKSVFVKPRKPLGLDKDCFDYEVDSDDEWEEEDPCGESLRGSDDEDKETEGDNEYEVDNEFFVPHGYLSDDELNEEEIAVESPEAHKTKLKLLKKEFDEEMKGQTQKIKPRVIGCIWENKFENVIEDAIYEFLKPFSVISNGKVIIKRRSELLLNTPKRKSGVSVKSLDTELIPILLKFVHGNTNKMKFLINEFLCELVNKGINTVVSKSSLKNEVKKFAEWMRNPEDGPMHNKFCWYVNKEAQEKYMLDLSVS